MRNRGKHFAIVKYIGTENDLFTPEKEYEAYFVEYWEGKRESLHVLADDGKIHDFIPLSDFEIISDPHNVLNFYEAKVKCITHRFDDELFDITYGKIYSAIGRDRNGMYLVMDESYCCYFYDSEDFEIIDDPHGILSRESVYYSYD